MANYYETLGIDFLATPEEIDRAYRFLAQKFHPDRNPDHSELAHERFKVIQEAYDVLSDREKRRDYDVKVIAGLDADWDPITMDINNGGVFFVSDGSLKVGKRHFRADEAVEKTTVGPATIEKDVGVGGEFRVYHNGQRHRFRYAKGQWYAHRLAQAKKEKPTKDPKQAARYDSTMAEYPSAPREQSIPRGFQAIFTSGTPQSSRTLLFAGALLVIGVVGGYAASRSGQGAIPLTAAEKAKAQEVELAQRQKLQEVEQKLLEQAAAEERQRQEQMLVRDRIAEVIRRGESAVASAAALLAELDQWEQQVPPLLTNDAGRKIAASEDRVRAFQALLAKPRLTREEAMALQREIEMLLAPLHAALTAERIALDPSEGLAERFLAKKQEADEATSALESHRRSILNLATLAHGDSSGMKTLEDEMREIDLRDAQREVELLAQTQRDARERSAAELAKAQQSLLDAEAEKERVEVEKQANAVRAQAELEKLMVEAKSRKVQQALRFFTTPGYFQPGPGARLSVRTVEPRPISYSKLAASGVLESTPDGIKKLYEFLYNAPQDLRANWNLPGLMYHLKPAQLQQLSEAQDYLNRLGPALVELEMLDP